MKYLFFSGILLLCFCSPSAKEIEIPWSPLQPLHFTDFKARPDTHKPWAGLSRTGIRFSYHEDEDSVTMHIQSYFLPSLSWLKTHDSVILKHEQLHFDICELFARLIKLRIGALPAGESSKSEVDSIYHKTCMELNYAQERYDRETEHSINGNLQQMWSDSIRLELQNSNDWHTRQPGYRKEH